MEICVICDMLNVDGNVCDAHLSQNKRYVNEIRERLNMYENDNDRTVDSCRGIEINNNRNLVTIKLYALDDLDGGD